MGKRKRAIKRLGWIVLAVFVLVNIATNLHAYHFTHFKDSNVSKTGKPEALSFRQKAQVLITGVSLPRPKNKTTLPSKLGKRYKIPSQVLLDAWHLIPHAAKRNPYQRMRNPLGTIIMFHGYGGEKTGMLRKARHFLGLNYKVLLVDFMGAGASEGNRTTLGFQEAQQVRDCYSFAQNQLGAKNIWLFGSSMGAAAILKSIHDHPKSVRPKGIMLECPFGTMYKTVQARFKKIKVPPVPLAAMLVFWGGVQNGYWGFSFSPERYARNVKCKTLLMTGGSDPYVSQAEIDLIYKHLKGPKKQVTFARSGHESYLFKYEKEWKEEIQAFLSSADSIRSPRNKSP